MWFLFWPYKSSSIHPFFLLSSACQQSQSYMFPTASLGDPIGAASTSSLLPKSLRVGPWDPWEQQWEVITELACAWFCLRCWKSLGCFPLAVYGETAMITSDVWDTEMREHLVIHYSYCMNLLLVFAGTINRDCRRSIQAPVKGWTCVTEDVLQNGKFWM